MNLPKKIKVGPFDYAVDDDLPALRKEMVALKAELLGWSDEITLRISINPEQAPGMLRDTLLHEVLHQVFNMTGQADEWGKEGAEEAILRLTPALLAVLRENPKVVDYLTGD